MDLCAGPDDPVHALPYDAFSGGEGKPQKLGTAVFPAVARFTRVCLYDRPNTTVGEDIESNVAALFRPPFRSRMRWSMTPPTSTRCSPPPAKKVHSCWPATPMAA